MSTENPDGTPQDSFPTEEENQEEINVDAPIEGIKEPIHSLPASLKAEADFLNRRFHLFADDLHQAADELEQLRNEISLVKSELHGALNSGHDIRFAVERLLKRLSDRRPTDDKTIG
jgi:hypothetical protein